MQSLVIFSSFMPENEQIWHALPVDLVIIFLLAYKLGSNDHYYMGTIFLKHVLECIVDLWLINYAFKVSQNDIFEELKKLMKTYFFELKWFFLLICVQSLRLSFIWIKLKMYIISILTKDIFLLFYRSSTSPDTVPMLAFLTRTCFSAASSSTPPWPSSSSWPWPRTTRPRVFRMRIYRKWPWPQPPEILPLALKPWKNWALPLPTVCLPPSEMWLCLFRFRLNPAASLPHFRNGLWKIWPTLRFLVYSESFLHREWNSDLRNHYFSVFFFLRPKFDILLQKLLTVGVVFYSSSPETYWKFLA